MSINNLRVLIIDGHLAVGRGLKALIEEIPGLRVVGIVTRGEHGLARAAESLPDVALVDAELPGLCSAAVIRLLRWRLPRMRVVALGIYPERLWAMRTAGAHELVLKDAGYEALRAAITGVVGAADSGVRGEADDTAGAVDHAAACAVGSPIAHGERVL